MEKNLHREREREREREKKNWKWDFVCDWKESIKISKSKRDFLFWFLAEFNVYASFWDLGWHAFPSIVCTSKAKGVVESGDLRLITSSSSWHPPFFLLKWVHSIHTWC
jgi:hypothetical protein